METRQIDSGITRRDLLKILSFLTLSSQFFRFAHAITVPVEESLEEALRKVLKGKNWSPSDLIKLEIPKIAENGSNVPITVESLIPATQRIHILAERNPGPLLATFEFSGSADPWISTRLKLNESGRVMVLAEAGGQFFGVETPVRVVVGGCG
jgi:sulfur-oxidizing protein SoxY